MVREARARSADGTSGAVRLLHGSYLQDWLADDSRRQLAGRRDRRRCLPGIRRHRRALVRSRRIRHRAPHHPALGADGRRCAQRVRSSGDHRGRRVVLFETDGVPPATSPSARSAPAGRTGCGSPSTPPAKACPSTRRIPRALWIGGRDVNRQLMRGTLPKRPRPPRIRSLPAGHPQGYQDCFDAFVADTYAAVNGEAPDGLPTFADGLRAARITAAVLELVRHRQSGSTCRADAPLLPRTRRKLRAA